MKVYACNGIIGSTSTKENNVTKKELLKQLEYVGDDEEIYFAHPSGNHWETVLVMPVSDIQVRAQVEPSEYHRSLVLVEDLPNSEKDVVEAIVLFG